MRLFRGFVKQIIIRRYEKNGFRYSCPKTDQSSILEDATKCHVIAPKLTFYLRSAIQLPAGTKIEEFPSGAGSVSLVNLGPALTENLCHLLQL
ncbi:MAG: hypothetical protein ACR2NN_16945 [Bryobacteraceae bacterium]